MELLTPNDVRRLLAEHGLAPRRAAGQNFVVDPNTVRKIVRDAGVGSDDEVLEIGAGLGSLTLALAQVVARVVAVEVDAGLARTLRETVGHLANVEVVHADALRADLRTLAGPAAIRVVANLPYNVATPLVFRSLEAGFGDLFVMVQREVGERWAARPRDAAYGAVSVKLALVASVRLVASVPRTVFYPQPQVDSVTVRIRQHAEHPDPDERARVVRVVDAAFGQRRKTLRNSLRSRFPDGVAEALLERAGIDPGLRAEEVDVAGFRRLGQALASHDAES